MILQVSNNLDQLPSTPSSLLSVNGTAGGTIVPVRNINSFTSQWAVQLGRTGEETAEILNIASVGGTTLNTSGTARFAHPADTPIYQIHYDSVVFSRSVTGTTGAAVALATVSITPDSFYTEYNDASGAATYAYQTQYYNSVSGDLSGTSAWFVPGGPTWYSLQKLRDRAKRNLFSAGYVKEDLTIDEWLNEWVEEMTNAALKLNQAYSTGTAAYSFGTAGLGTITDPLFKYASKIEITTDGVTYLPSTEIPLNQYSTSDIFNAASPRHSWQGDTIFQVLPYGASGTARMTLGKLQDQLTDETDELPQYLRGYTTKCLEYMLYRAKNLDGKDADAERHYSKFVNGKREFVGEMTPRDQTGPKFIEMDSLTGREEDMLINDFY